MGNLHSDDAVIILTVVSGILAFVLIFGFFIIYNATHSGCDRPNSKKIINDAYDELEKSQKREQANNHECCCGGNCSCDDDDYCFGGNYSCDDDDYCCGGNCSCDDDDCSNSRFRPTQMVNSSGHFIRSLFH
jgi:hypothetical protein